MLFKGFTATLAAIAVSFASFSAAPAKADNDTAKIIAGVAALAIIGTAIANDRKDRRHVSRHRGYNYYDPYYRNNHRAYRKHYHHKHRYHGHRHHGQRHYYGYYNKHDHGHRR